ncbi:hypothetical protein DZK27_13100 [Rhodobacteraceae bacterium 63075]|nr:hypothetical protein DZK27_13100 [Rhodobacteraceae bacterium 63075]
MFRSVIILIQKLRLAAYGKEQNDFYEVYPLYKEKLGELFVTAPEDVVAAAVEFDKPISIIGDLWSRTDSEEFEQLCDQISTGYFTLIERMRKSSFPKDQVSSEAFSTFSELLPRNRKTRDDK